MMKRLSYLGILIVLFLGAGPAGAKIDLVSLPDRDSVQLTIYNSADLTLVRESRELTLQKDGNISGWDEKLRYRVRVKNRRPVAAAVEIVRNVGSPNWDIALSGDYGEYTRVDADSVKFLLDTAPRSETEFTYTLTIRHGKRAE